MPLTLKAGNSSGESSYKLVPNGSHVAIPYIVADLGLQPGSPLFPDPKRKICILFEVTEERDEEGNRLTIRKEYTASMNEKANLRKDLVSWRGKEFTDEEAEAFDVASVLGKPAMINVVHKSSGDKTYANISTIGGLPKGFPKSTAENALLYYGEDNKGTFSKLPEWLQKKIESQIKAKPAPKQEEEYPDYNGQFSNDSTEITDDDIPF